MTAFSSSSSNSTGTGDTLLVSSTYTYSGTTDSIEEDEFLQL